MRLARPLVAYAATLGAFLALDAAWLAFVAVDLFRQSIGPIMRDTPLIVPAILFYLVYAAGLHALAVRPALLAGSLQAALSGGALLGLTAYATFDLTNLAIVRGWTYPLAVVDMAWGATASAVAASAGYIACSRLGPSGARPPAREELP